LLGAHDHDFLPGDVAPAFARQEAHRGDHVGGVVGPLQHDTERLHVALQHHGFAHAFGLGLLPLPRRRPTRRRPSLFYAVFARGGQSFAPS
jgi:hypothetical protein